MVVLAALAVDPVAAALGAVGTSAPPRTAAALALALVPAAVGELEKAWRRSRPPRSP